MANDIILNNDKVNAKPIYLSDDVGLLSQILEIAPGVITKEFWIRILAHLTACSPFYVVLTLRSMGV